MTCFDKKIAHGRNTISWTGFDPKRTNSATSLEVRFAQIPAIREGVQEPTRATALNCLLFAENGDSEQVIVLFESGAQ